MAATKEKNAHARTMAPGIASSRATFRNIHGPYHAAAACGVRCHVLKYLHLVPNGYPLKHPATVSSIQHSAQLASQTPCLELASQTPGRGKRYKHPVTSKCEELARQGEGKEQRARVSLTNSASPVRLSKPRGIRPLNITAFPIGEPWNREARMISQAYVTDRLSLSVRSGPADTDTDHDQGADTDTDHDQAVIRIRIMIKPRYGCGSRSGKKFP